MGINKRKLHLRTTINFSKIIMENSFYCTTLLWLNIALIILVIIAAFSQFKSNKNHNKRPSWFLGLLIISPLLVTALLFTLNNSHNNVLEVNFSENKIALFNPHAPVKNRDTDKYFKNFDIGFTLLKPSNNWSPVKRGSGLIDFLKMSGLKKDEITPEKLSEYNNDPFLQIFNQVTFFSFDQKDARIDLKFTDSTKVEYLKPYEKNYYDQTLEALNQEYPNNNPQNMYWADSLTTVAMQNVLGNLNIDFTAQFKLIAFPKNAFESALSDISLAGFYNVYSSSFGMNVSKIVANPNALLMGVHSFLENVLVNGNPQDIELNRYTHFSENEDFFFILEISHSPQAAPNAKQWEELSGVIESFRLL